MCHIILLLPLFGLILFVLLPVPVALPLYVIILAVSLVLYTAISRAMRRPVMTGAEGMIGRKGFVVDSVGRTLQIAVRDELWNAVSPVAIEKGQRIHVIGISGLLLQVIRDDGGSFSAKKVKKHCHS